MKPRTYFIDIDGCVLRQCSDGPMKQWFTNYEVLPGSREYLNQLEMEGHHIVLVTARPEHSREWLMHMLANLCIVYHQLVMGITSGHRYLINDEKPSSQELTAYAITIPRNKGIKSCRVQE